MNSPSGSTHQDTTAQTSASFSADDFARALETHDYSSSKGKVVRGKVFEYDGNGAYVDIYGKSSGFVPLREASIARVDTLEQLEEVLPKDEERDFLVVREQNADGQVTLSVRQLELQQSWERLEEIRDREGTVEAYVTGSNRGGVTVEVEGLRGFIPRSHLIERENLDALKGRQLTTTILELDRDRNKVVLSYRQAARAQRMGALVIGGLMDGEVVNLKPYGAFVDLGGVTGLLHVREISRKRIESVESFFQVGQKIKVVVADIDEWKNRISLSTKVLERYPGENLEKFDDVLETAEERWQELQQQQAGEKDA